MRLSRNARFAAPFVVAAAIGVGAAVPKLASGGAPHLPAITPAALVAKVAHAHTAGLSGTVSLTSDLGLPAGVGALAGGGSGSGIDVTTLLSGTHRFDVWLAGSDRQRITLTRNLGETDLVRNGGQVWVYDSTTEKVTHLLVSPGGPAGKSALEGLTRRLAPATSVEVGPSVDVAGRSCYTLRLAPTPGTPDALASTVGHVDVAVDAANGVPLRVEVYPRGAARPALVMGFAGSVSFAAPNAALFAPPHGLSQASASLPSLLAGGRVPGGIQARVTGSAWAPIVVVSGVHFGVADALVRLFTVPTHGIPGDPRALRSSLVNALVYPDGRIVAGFAVPDALQAAAAGPGGQGGGP